MMNRLIGLFVLSLLFAFVATSCTGGSPMRASGSSSRGFGVEFRGLGNSLASTESEELWVIAQDPNAGLQRIGKVDVGEALEAGGMIMIDPSSEVRMPIPLDHTDVRARVRGHAATVEVEQRFSNPFDTKIEAVYVFPLPTDGAVNEFLMTIGERTIRGIVREREEAERIYEEAKSQGHVASLMTQERPNVFTQKVANIEPGKRIDVKVTYLHSLPFRDGSYEFVFPMVVGPRYNPVGAPNPLATTYLRPGERTGHDIALSVDLDAGLALTELDCETHEIDVQRTNDAGRAHITLAGRATIPDRDFVLRYSVTRDVPNAAFFCDAPGPGGLGAFSLTIEPPLSASAGSRIPMEMIFVVDASGSMKGQPLDLAKEAMLEALEQLEETDRFRILRFSDRGSWLTGGALAGTVANLREGRRMIRKIKAGGGTEMMSGLRTVLALEQDEEFQRVICFLTDGYIGNEEEVLGEVRQSVGDARIFSFGIGSSVNRFLMERMASEGRGAVAYVGEGTDSAQVMRDYFTRVSRPVLSDLQIDWGGMRVEDVVPSRLPDLFCGRPVTVRGRFVAGSSEPPVIGVSGRIRGGGENRVARLPIPVRPGAFAERAEALTTLWARAKVADLMSEARAGKRPAACARKIRRLALEHGLLSQYTAFLAVDSSVKTKGTHGVTVPVPVPVPAGVRYETTVGGE